MFNNLITFTQSFWSAFKNSSFYKGIIYTAPNARTIHTAKNSAITQSLLSQIFYFNILFYLLPVLIFNLILKPIAAFNIGNEYIATAIENILNVTANLYFLKITAVMFLYNALLTICTSSIATSQIVVPNESTNKICDCSKAEKLQQLLKGSFYYLSNNIFSNLIGIFTHPFIALPFKIITQGQGFIEGALANNGACPKHRRLWLTKHNLFALGVGTSFVLTQFFSERIVGIVLDVNSLNFLTTFILQDSLSNLIWLSFMYNIYFSPNLVSLSDEYACDFFMINNNVVDTLYSYFRPKIEKIINNLDKINNHKYSLPAFIKNSFTPEVFLNAPPMQLFLAHNQSSLLIATVWLSRLDSVSFMITDSEWLISRERLKFILSNLVPKTAVNLIFMAVTRGYLSESNVTWLEHRISSAQLDPIATYPSMRFMRFLINKSTPTLQKIHRRYCHMQEKRSFEVVDAPSPVALSASSSSCNFIPSPATRVAESPIEEWNLILGLNDIQVVKLAIQQLRIYRRTTDITSSMIDNHFTAPRIN